MLSALTLPDLSLMFMLYSQNPQGEFSHMHHEAEREEIWAYTTNAFQAKVLTFGRGRWKDKTNYSCYIFI